jgi:hypothetical protein
MKRPGVVDLPMVRASLARLDALALAHPELVGAEDTPEARAAWKADLANMENPTDDEEEANEAAGDAVSDGEAHRAPTVGVGDVDPGPSGT